MLTTNDVENKTHILKGVPKYQCMIALNWDYVQPFFQEVTFSH